MQKVLDNILCGIRATVFRRNTLTLTLTVFVVLGVFLATSPAYAFEIQKYIAMALAWLCFYTASFLGELLLILINALIWVAEYNGFAQSHAVVNGWIIVRDVVNMFFIVVLLVIAFGTILGVEQYSYRNKRLTTLLLMAVVVNFSRTICGILIDFAQVIMLTFVNGFSQAAGGNFIEAFGLTKIFQAGKIGTEGKSGDMVWGIALSMMLAVVMTLVALWVIITMIAVLVVRIVYLWILIVLSPLAFFLKGVPGGQASKYYGDWWKKFTDQVVVGPVMAFILWLALVSVAAGGDEGLAGKDQGFPAHKETKETKGFSEAFSNAEIEKFIIAIGLLLGGVQMAKSMSPVAGVVSGAVKAGAQRAGMGALKWAGRRAGRGAVGAVKGLDRATGFRAARARVIPLTKSKLKSGAGTLLAGGGLLRSSKQKAEMYRQMEADARRHDDFDKAKKYGERAKTAEDKYKSRGTMGKAMEGVWGATGAAGAALKRSAAGDIKEMGVKEHVEIQDARKEIKDQTVEQKMSAVERMKADGDVSLKERDKDVATVMDLVTDGAPEMRGNIDEVREILVKAKVDKASMEQFEADVKKHFPDEASYIPHEEADSPRNIKLREDQWSAGNMGPQLAQAFNDTTMDRVDPAIRQSFAVEYANAPAPARVGMMKKMSWPEQQNMGKELEKIQDENVKQDQWDPKIADAIMRLRAQAKGKDSMGVAYGIDAKGDFTAPYQEASYASSLGQRGAEDVLANTAAGSLVDKSGKATGAGRAFAKGVGKNLGILNKLLRKAVDEGNEDIQASLDAAIACIFQEGDKKSQDYVTKSTALRHLAPPKPKTPTAPDTGGGAGGGGAAGGAADSGAREVDLPEGEGASPEVDEGSPPGGRGGRRGPAGGGDEGGEDSPVRPLPPPEKIG